MKHKQTTVIDRLAVCGHCLQAIVNGDLTALDHDYPRAEADAMAARIWAGIERVQATAVGGYLVADDPGDRGWTRDACPCCDVAGDGFRYGVALLGSVLAEDPAPDYCPPFNRWAIALAWYHYDIDFGPTDVGERLHRIGLRVRGDDEYLARCDEETRQAYGRVVRAREGWWVALERLRKRVSLPPWPGTSFMPSERYGYTGYSKARKWVAEVMGIHERDAYELLASQVGGGEL